MLIYTSCVKFYAKHVYIIHYTVRALGVGNGSNDKNGNSFINGDGDYNDDHSCDDHGDDGGVCNANRANGAIAI